MTKKKAVPVEPKPRTPQRATHSDIAALEARVTALEAAVYFIQHEHDG